METPKEDNNALDKLSQNNTGLKIPPPVFLDMAGEIIEASDTTYRVRFPVKERYQNPLGYMQGGMLVAAIDNAVGPLSFTVAEPSVTTQLNVTYLRPATPEISHIIVTATFTERTRRQIFLKAEVHDENGRLLCFAHATQVVVGG